MKTINDQMPTDDSYINLTSKGTHDTTQELLQEELNAKVTSFRRNRASRTQAYRKLEKKYVWLRNFTGLAVIALLTSLLLTVASLKRVSTNNLQLNNEIQQSNQRNETLLAEMQGLRVENDTMVQGRIPGLIPLKFDDPYKLNELALKSVVFTRTEYNSELTYEYLAVIHNNTNEVIRPSSRLLLFDKYGVQVGEGNIAIAEQFSGELQLISLEPGESHSFSGKFQMTGIQEPKYFKLVHK